MINPDKHIRKAFYNRLTAAGLQVFDTAVPKSYEPGPKYIIITNQTQVDDQLGRACTHRDCTIVLDLFVLQDLSYVSSAVMDDFYEQVMNLIDNTLQVENFQLHSIQRDGTPRNMPVNTGTLSILRKVITYRLRLKELTHVEP
ncbi:hypothetical protein C8N40_111122 [Pontibacter mucosus]|uniref:Uncharacterized protein n=1 Tax=Pontibacter mucosus TaxID=1649266 RepID=A0A2T5YD37_9BACT|nr:hypothetical protein [Pontibacter mucosus]PTX14457.1 hypothetical protein C8N40_111122 [Pontibacter mucosus]